jgi:S-adenosyl-L-methionine hydrolase (adenosine-forming)
MPATISRPRAPIAILTDFGYRDHYVGAMKGVITSLAPGTSIIDITHGIPPQQITAGAIALRESWRFFPHRTIFLAVVDPGVGTNRLPIAVATRAGARFVGPDNGLLWLAAEAAGVRSIVELTAARFRLADVSTTFHGRDVFAPAAAWLSTGVSIAALGRRLAAMTQLDLSDGLEERPQELRGAVIYIDGFGNLITNISRAQFERFATRFRAHRLSVTIGQHASIAIQKAYGDAPAGAPLATFGSFDMLEVAIRNGSAAERYAAGIGTRVRLRAYTRSTCPENNS